MSFSQSPCNCKRKSEVSRWAEPWTQASPSVLGQVMLRGSSWAVFYKNPQIVKFSQTSKGVHCTQLYPSPNQGSRKRSSSSDDKGLGHFKFRAPAGREREEVCEHLRDAGALCTYVTWSLKLYHNPEQCLGLIFVQTGVSLPHESKKYQVTEKSHHLSSIKPTDRAFDTGELF